MEGLLRDLERDVERRERFLRECARMVGAFPELEEEVRKICQGLKKYKITKRAVMFQAR